MPTIVSIEPQADSDVPSSGDGRWQRTRRIKLAWGTSVASTATTFAIQIIAVPLVYRSLGESGYAAYAAISAAAGLISILQLGIGGSLVTPIAAAAAEDDKSRQAVLIQAGLAPLLVLCLIGTVVAIPAVALLPLRVLLGKIAAVGSANLRVAALIAASAALLAVPLSAIDILRQAYQELHIGNLLGAGSNVLICLALVTVATHSKALALFVTAFLLPPLALKVINWSLLFAGRRYLLRRMSPFPWRESRDLLGDGIRYLSASFSHVLVYQWPIYWIARSLSPNKSAPFAVFMQIVIFSLSFMLGFLRPMWSSAADAHSRGDRAWLRSQRNHGRVTIVLVGVGLLAAMVLIGQQAVRIWIRQPITMDWQTRALIGAYIMLALWEQLHFLLALGLGHLRAATAAVFQRAVAFSLLVPLLVAFGGPKALWLGMCCSILLWTGWRLPKLLAPAAQP